MSLWKREPRSAGRGLGLQPGAAHYRAYVGPPEDYDLIGAMVFNLLTCIGLRGRHRVLDIGCGSLRVGRLLIPYLEAGNYFGVEPNRWLVNDAIRNEIGRDLLRIKRPTFSFESSLKDFAEPLSADFALAQSIFSHCGRDLIEAWLEQVSLHLKETGALLATFLPAEEDFSGLGWIYPESVKYRPQSIADRAARFGLDFNVLDWAHPRQTWALMAKKGFDRGLIEGGAISWNRFVESELGKLSPGDASSPEE